MDELDLQSTGTVVIGGEGGIGRAAVQHFRRAGRECWSLDRTGGDPDHFAHCDISDPDDIASAARAIAATGTVVGTLVLVAGTNHFSMLEDMSTRDWDHVMAVNVVGFSNAMEVWKPDLVRVRGASVVLMSSVAAHVGTSGYAAYVASKAAVQGLTVSYARDLGADGIRVNAICPGWVDTTFSDNGIDLAENPAEARTAANMSHVLGRMAHPDEIAASIGFLSSDAAAGLNGRMMYVDGGFMVKR